MWKRTMLVRAGGRELSSMYRRVLNIEMTFTSFEESFRFGQGDSNSAEKGRT